MREGSCEGEWCERKTQWGLGREIMCMSMCKSRERGNPPPSLSSAEREGERGWGGCLDTKGENNKF